MRAAPRRALRLRWASVAVVLGATVLAIAVALPRPERSLVGECTDGPADAATIEAASSISFSEAADFLPYIGWDLIVATLPSSFRSDIEISRVAAADHQAALVSGRPARPLSAAQVAAVHRVIVGVASCLGPQG